MATKIVKSGTHVRNGKAFEWAVATAIAKQTSFTIIDDQNAAKPKGSFSEISPAEQQSFDKAAMRAVKHLIGKEGKFFDTKVGLIKFQSDAAGKSGDVRDLVISANNKEIGISCKNNHADLKHSRLSDVADFVKEWGLDTSGCSQTYWDEIKPFFANIKEHIKNELAQKNIPLWDAYPRKIDTYWGVLNAWANEIWRCYGKTEAEHDAFCAKIITYLFGTHDFYKVIRHGDTSVDVQCVNFKKALTKPYARYPSVIRAIDNLNGGQYSKTIVFNNGFSINFRIHSADSKLNTSLKFAISAISLPVGQFYQQTLEV
jgi:hypothetical protein